MCGQRKDIAALARNAPPIVRAVRSCTMAGHQFGTWGKNFMRWEELLSGALAALFICGPVMAQTVPLLSGKYATTYNEICQAETNATNHTVGATYNQILVADFDNATKTVKLTGPRWGTSTAVLAI